MKPLAEEPREDPDEPDEDDVERPVDSPPDGRETADPLFPPPEFGRAPALPDD